MNDIKKINSVDYYFDDINKCRYFTQAQVENKIIELRKPETTKERAAELRQEIVETNLKVVIKFAKEYQNVGVPLADLIQEGNIGLLHAISKYQLGKSYKFTTYAVWWMKQGFLKAIKYNSRLIRMPTYVQEALSRIEKLRNAFERETGTEPSIEYLAEQEGLTEEELEKIYNVSMDPISLEAVFHGSEAQKNLKDFLPDPSIDLDRDIDSSRLSEDIRDALEAYLTKEEQEVMIYRYGLMNQTVHTLEEVASLIGKSREHVRQLETSGKDKLRAMAAELDNYRE